MRADKQIAVGVGFLMGFILSSTIVVTVFFLLGFISVDLANVLLMVCLVWVTAIYTLATYGQWWKK